MRLAGFALVILGAAMVLAYSILHRPAPPELPDRLVYEIASFDDLPGWDETSASTAFAVFQTSCEFIRRTRAPTDPSDPDAADWLEACAAADNAMVAAMDIESIARNFFQGGFIPIRILNNRETEGMFTGYYEPQLRGNLTRTDEFSTPLLARPADLVMVNLSEFPGDRTGRIAGRVGGGYLHPFEDRAAIEDGALENTTPIVWIDDPVDAFFLHIQGSGRVALEDGSVVRVGYDGQNGHPYTAIGRILVQQGAITLEEASMQSIRAWLVAHPDEGREVMRANASYIFFREIDVDDPNLGPLGAAGVPLTPGYSLAVDRTYHALGAPVYVATTLPDGTPFERLMVMQDTGGAIRSPIRGDIFFGFGEEPGEIAGAMRSQGEMWVLAPNAVAERIAAEQE